MMAPRRIQFVLSSFALHLASRSFASYNAQLDPSCNMRALGNSSTDFSQVVGKTGVGSSNIPTALYHKV